MKRSFLFLPLGLALVAFAACSSGGGSGGPIDGSDAGFFDATRTEGGDAEDVPQQAVLRTSGSGEAGCADVPVLEIGEFGNPAAEPPVPATPIPNGRREDGSIVQVYCEVVPKGGGYRVYATVGRSGTTFELEADVDSSGATNAGGVVLIGPKGTWTSETCTLAQSAPYMGVATGRYWATFSCPSSTSTPNVTCDVAGEVRLENCTQKEP
jgi:hypothetical protein